MWLSSIEPCKLKQAEVSKFRHTVYDPAVLFIHLFMVEIILSLHHWVKICTLSACQFWANLG